MCLAIPGMIMSITGQEPLARIGQVALSGTVRDVRLACVPDAQVGDYVIVHAGIALSTLNATEAQQVFDYLAYMDEQAAPGEAPV